MKIANVFQMVDLKNVDIKFINNTHPRKNAQCECTNATINLAYNKHVL